MIRNGKLVCNSCGKAVLMTKCVKVYRPKKTDEKIRARFVIEDWDVCQPCCKLRSW